MRRPRRPGPLLLFDALDLPQEAFERQAFMLSRGTCWCCRRQLVTRGTRLGSPPPRPLQLTQDEINHSEDDEPLEASCLADPGHSAAPARRGLGLARD
jgi:hypothetical protein